MPNSFLSPDVLLKRDGLLQEACCNLSQEELFTYPPSESLIGLAFGTGGSKSTDLPPLAPRLIKSKVYVVFLLSYVSIWSLLMQSGS